LERQGAQKLNDLLNAEIKKYGIGIEAVSLDSMHHSQEELHPWWFRPRSGTLFMQALFGFP